MTNHRSNANRPSKMPSHGMGLGSTPNATAKSLARRRRLSFLAFLLGIGSVAFSVITVVSSQLQEREADEAQYLKSTEKEIRILTLMVDLNATTDEKQLLPTLHELWLQVATPGRDERFVIMDNTDLQCIFDSLAAGGLHRPVDQRVIRGMTTGIRDVMRFRVLFSDDFESSTGEPFLGSFMNVSKDTRDAGRNWMLGIFRSKAGLHEDVARSSPYRTIILVCGLGIPLSLFLMYVAYLLAQRDQVRSEAARSRLAAIVESSGDAIFSQTWEGVITSWNRGAEQLFGYLESEAVGKRSAELIPSEREPEEREIIAGIRRGNAEGEYSLETTRRCKDDHAAQISQRISPIENALGHWIGISVIARDITAQRNLEREVLESAGREQQRIGRELHDSLGQELTGLSYLAKGLSQKLVAEENPHQETAETISAGAQRALREVRAAVQGLVPVEVDASGFIVALEKLATDTRTRCAIDCRIENHETIQIDDNALATHLYRIVQEAINNAVKHAHARTIVVRPETQNGTLRVTVHDDGVGIANGSASSGGMGLRIMRYRAGVIGATLDVETTEGKGTAVVCQLKKTDHPDS